MTRLSDAWATRASTAFAMLHVGDSVTEGTGGVGVESKYATKLLRLLQTDAGISGGPGFVNSGSYSAADAGLASVYNPVGSVQGAGFIAERSGQTGVNVAQTITFTGTSIDIHHFGSGEAYSATLDGTNVGPITPSSTPVGGSLLRGKWHSPVVAHGTHTLVLTPGSGKQLYIRGVHIYDGDESTGVHGYEAGHFGTTSTIQAGDTAGYFSDAGAVIQPAVVTIFLGLNDLTAPTVPATYGSNLASIVTAISGYCTIAPSFVICAPYARPDTPSPTYALSLYTAAAKAAADADTTNRRFVDLNLAGLAGGDFADGVHPNDGGHTKLAAAIRPAVLSLAGVVLPPSGWTTVAAERWSGSAWVPVIAEKWNGTAWVPCVLERAT